MAQQRIWPQDDGNTPVSWPSRLGEYEKRLLFEIAELSTVFVLHAIVRLVRRQWRHFRRPTTSGVKARRRGGGAAAAAGRCRTEWQRQRQREMAAWLDAAVGHAATRRSCRRTLAAVTSLWRHLQNHAGGRQTVHAPAYYDAQNSSIVSFVAAYHHHTRNYTVA